MATLQPMTLILGRFLATETWAQRMAASPYALALVWILFVLLTAHSRGTAAAQAKTNFYTLPSQPKVALISTSAENLVGVYLKSKNQLDKKIFVLKLDGGHALRLVQKRLGSLHH